MNANEFPKTGQRLTLSTQTEDIHIQENPAIPASADDIARDTAGFTNPNLHRRIRINTMQEDGKKVYTIAQPFTASNSDTIYEIKYPISSLENIRYLFVYGVPVFVYDAPTQFPPISNIIESVEDTQTHAVTGFKFKLGYIPQAGTPFEIIYKTNPLIDGEAKYREYGLAISGVHSYRTTKVFLHTEEDEGNRNQRIYENEIP